MPGNGLFLEGDMHNFLRFLGVFMQETGKFGEPAEVGQGLGGQRSRNDPPEKGQKGGCFG